jgi:hypothetical protein
MSLKEGSGGSGRQYLDIAVRRAGEQELGVQFYAGDLFIVAGQCIQVVASRSVPDLLQYE